MNAAHPNAGTDRHAPQNHAARRHPNGVDLLANHQAERAVNAGLMRCPDARTAAQHIIHLSIHVELFTHPTARAAFEAIDAYLTDGIQPDAATLRAVLDDATLIEVETSLQEHASAANLPVYVKLLKDCQRNRTVHAARDALLRAIQAGRPATELRKMAEAIEALQSPETATGAPESKPCFVWVQDFCALPPTEVWSIEDYFEPDTLCVMYGDSEAYKSFLAVDIACHIATGKNWRGKEVKPGIALYIAGEGGNGLRKRLRAWFEYHQEPMRNVAISTVPRALCDPANVAELVAHTERFLKGMPMKPSNITLDTLNTHFGDGDENNTADMTRFMAGLRTLRIATGATILVPHHCGLAAKDRGRGSIVLHNGIDWEYRLERSPESQTTTLTCTKCKDHEKPAPLSWHLEAISLPWADAKGRPLNSAVLIPNDSIPAARPVQEKMGIQQRRALETLEELYRTHRKNLEDSGHDPDTARVSLEDWHDAMHSVSEDRSNRAKIRKVLVERGHVVIDGDFVYITNTTEAR